MFFKVSTNIRAYLREDVTDVLLIFYLTDWYFNNFLRGYMLSYEVDRIAYRGILTIP